MCMVLLLCIVFQINSATLEYTMKLQKKCEYNWTVHQLFIDFMKAYDSDKREVRLIKMY
jgi:hypothetical protein